MKPKFNKKKRGSPGSKTRGAFVGSGYSRSGSGNWELTRLICGGAFVVLILCWFISSVIPIASHYWLFRFGSPNARSELDHHSHTLVSRVKTPSVSSNLTEQNYINQINNNKGLSLSQLRDEWYHLRQKCPQDGYEKKAVPLHNLKEICNPERLDRVFKVGTDCQNCASCVKYGEQEEMVKIYRQSENERLQQLQNEILNKLEKPNGNSEPILLMVLNYGYSWLFLNWVCSLQKHGIEDAIKKRTLIVVSDKKTLDLVEKAGFTAHYPHWLGEFIKKIDEKPAISFGLGAHRYLVSIQIMLVNDLIRQGYNVILQDTDIIWTGDVFDYLSQNSYFDNFDLQMSVDLRMDERGPGNSGFLILRSSCKSRVFMNTMVNLVHLVLEARSDQNLWNVVLTEKWFRQLHFQLLDSDRFIGGHQVSLNKRNPDEIIIRFENNKLPSDMLLMHAAWTTDQMDKIEKFYRTGHWYFNQQCSYFDSNLLPDVAYRRKHVAEKVEVQRQKEWLLSLGLVQNSGVDPGL